MNKLEELWVRYTVKNYQPPKLWVVMFKILKLNKIPFAVTVIGPIIWVMLTDIRPSWLGYILLFSYMYFFICAVLGAIGHLLNNRKIRGLCEKLGITVKQWNKIRDEEHNN